MRKLQVALIRLQSFGPGAQMIEAGGQNEKEAGRSVRTPKQALDQRDGPSIPLLQIQTAGHALDGLAIMMIELESHTELIFCFCQLLLVQQSLNQGAMKIVLGRG